MNPRYSSLDHDNMATAVIQSSSSITANNISIQNSAYIIDTNSYYDNGGIDVECFVFRISGSFQDRMLKYMIHAFMKPNTPLTLHLGTIQTVTTTALTHMIDATEYGLVLIIPISTN